MGESCFTKKSNPRSRLKIAIYTRNFESAFRFTKLLSNKSLVQKFVSGYALPDIFVVFPVTSNFVLLYIH
jgi:hypothetical protein